MAVTLRTSLGVLSLALYGLLTAACVAQDSAPDPLDLPFGTPPDLQTLAPEKWDQIDDSIHRALNWLQGKQAPDGSIPTYISGNPGITSLAALAFLSAGEQPGIGERGEFIDRAIDYVLSCQRPDDMFLVDSTDMPATQFERGSHTGLYNHAITCLMLSEAYGSTEPERARRMRTAIEKGLVFARKMQTRPQLFPVDQGGFRYFKSAGGERGNGDADVSVTGWFVMFFRSAKNAGFDVPEAYIDDATRYIRRCYDPERNGFRYTQQGLGARDVARGMTGAGIVCVTLAGKPDEEIARDAGQWILDHPFDRYGGKVGFFDRFHYGAYYCSQAMFLLGGNYWARFYPPTMETLLANQNSNGSWPPEQTFSDGLFGSEYTTALSVLTLSSPFQLLPIHQR
jgi:hypothetical protein